MLRSRINQVKLINQHVIAVQLEQYAMEIILYLKLVIGDLQTKISLRI